MGTCGEVPAEIDVGTYVFNPV